MEFNVEFYESASGDSPVFKFLAELKETDPNDYAAVMAGLARLRNRQYHRPSLSKPIGDGLFELRHVGKLNTRVLYCFMIGRRIIALHGIRNKGQQLPDRDRQKSYERMAQEAPTMKRKTNFDALLEKDLRDPAFAERFRQAGEAWDVAIRLAAIREKAGLSQSELARRVGTTQQQISRLESSAYEGHSLTMLRRVARALDCHVKVVFEPGIAENPAKPPSRAKNALRTPKARSTKSSDVLRVR